LCDRVTVSIRSGKLSFHDWKSQGKVREFYYRRPVGTLIMIYAETGWPQTRKTWNTQGFI